MKTLTEASFSNILDNQEHDFEIVRALEKFIMENPIAPFVSEPWKTDLGFWHSNYKTIERQLLTGNRKVPYIIIGHDNERKSNRINGQLVKNEDGTLSDARPVNILKSIRIEIFKNHKIIEKEITKSFWGKEKITLIETHHQLIFSCFPFCVNPEQDIEHYLAYRPELIIPFNNFIDVINDSSTLLDDIHKEFLKSLIDFFSSIINKY